MAERANHTRLDEQDENHLTYWTNDRLSGTLIADLEQILSGLS